MHQGIVMTAANLSTKASELGSAAALLTRVDTLDAELRRARRHYAARLAEEFSPFELLALREPDLSRVLADLINPNGTHGQGRLFLDALLNSVERLVCADGKTPAARQVPQFGEDVCVYTEYAANGRIDVLLENGSDRLALELKPWAGEQEDQMARYAAWLERNTPGRWLLIYLCERPSHTLPSRASQRAHIVHLTFEAFGRALREAAVRAQALRVRVFAETFADYLIQYVAGVDNMNQTDPLLDLLLRPENLAAARRIYEIYPRVRRKAWETFVDHLEKATQNRYGKDGSVKFEYSTADDLMANKWVYFWFTFTEDPRWSVCFGDESGHPLRQVFWGLSRNGDFLFDQDVSLWDELHAKAKDCFGEGKKNKYWAWWRLGEKNLALEMSKEQLLRVLPRNLEDPAWFEMMLEPAGSALEEMIFQKVDAVRAMISKTI